MLSSESVKEHARGLGFDACGIAPAAAFPELQFLRDWLSRGYAGTMAYLPRTAERRTDVRRVLPSARSVIVTATLYNTDRPSSIESTDPAEAIVSRYAWGDDYHAVVGERLDALLSWMRAEGGSAFEARRYVDTGPIQERVYAQYAGLGWIGKNTCLINPGLGSFVFLGEIVCSLELEPDAHESDRCGACHLCLEACPTGALVEPGVLDATRCVSYLTIERKGALPEPLREGVGRRVFGCDVCQDVCPWNLTGPVTADGCWLPRAGLDRPGIAGLWRRTDDELSHLVEGTAMTRPGVIGLRRNLAVAAGNSGDPLAIEALAERGASPRAPDGGEDIVGEHIVWARRTHGRRGSKP